MDRSTLQFGRPESKPVVNLRLGGILGVEVVKRKFLLTTKPVLVITYASGNAPDSARQRVWLITADIERWRAELAGSVPQQRFAADVPVEIHVDAEEVTVIAQLSTGARNNPPIVFLAPDSSHLVLTAAGGAERWVELPVEVVGVTSVDVGSTATMVITCSRRSRR